MSKQEWLAQALAACRLMPLARKLSRAPGSSQFVVLAYHRVVRTPPDESYRFDTGLISATESEFDWQMEFLKRHMNVMPLRDLLTRVLERQEIPANSAAITFDDGFADNYDVAFEVLKRHGLTATFFVATEWVDRQKPIWFEICAYACMTLPPGSLVLDILPEPLPMAEDRAARVRSMRLLLDRMKEVSNSDRLAAMAEIQQHLGTTEFEDDWPRDSRPLTWEQIRKMRRHGIDFGSHSVTHSILSRTTRQELDQELAGSRRRLQQELGCEIDLLAYPVGGASCYNDQVIAAARANGYRFGISYQTGTNQVEQFDPFGVRRQHVELGLSRARFEALLSLPSIFN